MKNTGGRPPRFKVEQIAAALRRTAGLASAAAELLHCPHSTVRNYMKRHPSLAAIADETAEAMLDLSESKLYAAINAGTDWAVKFYLETKGKNRGYTRRTELTGPAGKPIEVKDAGSRLIAELDQMAARLRSIPGRAPGAGTGEPAEPAGPGQETFH